LPTKKTSLQSFRTLTDDARFQNELKSKGQIPTHIAIIMDGNGRWAKERGLPRIAGHKEGVESVRDTVEACGQLGVRFLTLYAFSTENWRRPENEVSLLMRLLLHAIRDETDKLHSNNVRMQSIGEIFRLPKEIQEELLDGIEKTKNNTGLTLTLALSYSGRWDITQAVIKLAQEIEQGKMTSKKISEETITQFLSTQSFPDPDLLVRTGGDMRISNFLLWQIAYAELFVSKLYWPQFRREELYNAIIDFQQRERRYGMISEQIKNKTSLSKKMKVFINQAIGNK